MLQRAGDEVSTVENELTDEEIINAPLFQRSPRISQAEIFRAADELLIEGHRPSIDRVRMRLGRGSPNTIQHHMEIWWTKLGARLRDLPDRTFPQVPERVGHALQLLWNEALEGAHETLRRSILEREEVIAQQGKTLEARTKTLAEREQVAATRAAAVEENLALVREQLSAANRRAENLESALRSRDTESVQLRDKITALETSAAGLRGRLDAATTTYQAERAKLEDRYSAAEARWLTEVDRARQTAKDADKEHERQVKELRGRVGSLQKDRDQIRQDLMEARSSLKATAVVREQLEERLLASPPVRTSKATRPKRKYLRKPK